MLKKTENATKDSYGALLRKKGVAAIDLPKSVTSKLKALNDEELESAQIVTSSSVKAGIERFNKRKLSSRKIDMDRRAKVVGDIIGDSGESAYKPALGDGQKTTQGRYLNSGAAKILSNVNNQLMPTYDGGRYYGRVSIIVSLDGEFLRIKLEKSGNSELDQVYLDAILKTKRIDMPPDELVRLSMIRINFWFDEKNMRGYPDF
jgi:hypothetical protein